MSRFLVRKLLRKANLLDSARALKRRLFGRRGSFDFKPADPRLCVSTMKCLEWVHRQGLLEGTDYMEFGIFRGFNVWYTQALARAWGVQDMRFFGFDSFFGLPPVEGIDAGGCFHEGDFSAYKEDVAEALGRFGVDWQRTFLVEGFFDQSLNQRTIDQYALRRCSYCVVDCDLYSSTKTVLQFLHGMLADVAILYFDDWYDFGKTDLKGEPKAFQEFMEAYGRDFEAEPFEDLIALGGKGVAFIMRRKVPAGTGEPCCAQVPQAVG